MGCSSWIYQTARMHLRNGDMPYHSTEDALRFWPEQVTAIGVQLHADDQIGICAPYGLEDLYANERVCKKNWQQHWPKLTIVRA